MTIQLNWLTTSVPFTGDAFHPLHQLWCPSLDAFEHLPMFLRLWGPEMHTVPRGGCTLDEYSGMVTFPDWLVMLCLMHTGWGLLSGLSGHILTHVGPTVNQDPQITFCRTVLQPLLSQVRLVLGITLS